jgi:hypothetical protein
MEDDDGMPADDGANDASPLDHWHTAHDLTIDTDVEPSWLRTGYRYFPYAALESGRWWVIRVNYCFPEHDIATLFIDGAAVADLTAVASDVRPLVASIGRMPMTNPDSADGLQTMPRELARRVVGGVADFVDHGSEWGQPCPWCTFAEHDPFTRADDSVDHEPEVAG